MATERATLAYRPDEEERRLLEALAKRYGLSKSRLIGLAVRQMAERDKVTTGGYNEPAEPAGKA
jgi:hypothetical protein